MNNITSTKSIFKDKLISVISDKIFTVNSVDQNFQHHVFRDVGAKKIEFVGCDFSYCIFERAYFHACNFRDCKFIGARFIDCNFRNAGYDGCQFEYAIFKSTLVPHNQILRNLPAWPNVKRELLRTLRVNAESIGDAEAVKDYVREELAASREHLKKARQGKESYYAKKYKGFDVRLNIYWQSIWSWLDWHLWGHGEYPGKLFRTIIYILLGCTLYRLSADISINSNSTISETISFLFIYFAQSVYVFFGVIPDKFPYGLATILAAVRYISLGLFISVLYKRLARR